MPPSPPEISTLPAERTRRRCNKVERFQDLEEGEPLLSPLLAGYAAIYCAALATSSSSAITRLASLDTTSAAGAGTSFASVGPACSRSLWLRLLRMPYWPRVAFGPKPPEWTLSSSPPPRTPYQEGWDLYLHCRKHCRLKRYYHCWFCNFK